MLSKFCIVIGQDANSEITRYRFLHTVNIAHAQLTHNFQSANFRAALNFIQINIRTNFCTIVSNANNF